MADTPYQTLSADQRREALQVAARSSGHRTYVLEKDIWLVATLGVLFEAPFGRHLVFKGGTSLSKVWRAIHRFSEDIDITYDIRRFAPDLVGGAGDEALPPTRSQEKRWTKVIRRRLAEWVRDRAGPLVKEELGRAGFAARIRAASERLYIGYDPLFRAARDHAAGSPSRLWCALHGRTSHRPNGRVRCRPAPSRLGVSGSTACRHVCGADILGEGDLDACLLPPRTSSGRALVEALARPRPPRRRRDRGPGLWRIANSLCRSPATRRCSSARTIRTDSGSTITPPFRATSGSFRGELGNSPRRSIPSRTA